MAATVEGQALLVQELLGSALLEKGKSMSPGRCQLSLHIHAAAGGCQLGHAFLSDDCWLGILAPSWFELLPSSCHEAASFSSCRLQTLQGCAGGRATRRCGQPLDWAMPTSLTTCWLRTAWPHAVCLPSTCCASLPITQDKSAVQVAGLHAAAGSCQAGPRIPFRRPAGCAWLQFQQRDGGWQHCLPPAHGARSATWRS